MAETAKTSRASAKRCFTRATKALLKAINNDSGVKIVQSRFEDLQTQWEEVQRSHEAYLQIVLKDEEETPEEHEVWIDELMDRFDDLESQKEAYIRDASRKDVDLERQRESKRQEEEEKQRSHQREEERKRRERIRRACAVSFEEDIKNLEDLLNDEESVKVPETIKEARRDLKDQLNRCQDAHTEYLAYLDDEMAVEEESWMRSLKERLNKLTQICEPYLKKNSREEKHDSKDTSSGLRMHRLQMPSFSGNIREYPRFKSDFLKQVLPEIKKETSAAYVLRSCLSGEPLNLVSNVDDDIKEMWARLDDRYGRPSKLTDVIMNDIKRYRPIADGDYKRFVEYVNLVEKGYRDLERIGMEKEISNSHTVSLVEEKMPERISWEWSKEVNKRDSKVDEKDKFPHLLDFLIEQRRIIEYNSSDIRNYKTNNKGNVHMLESLDAELQDNLVLNAEKAESETPTDGRRCCVHKSDTHTTTQCRTYMNMTSEDRVKSVRENRGCWSCLRIGHRSADCKFRRQCGIDGCTKYHHDSLHEAEVLGIAFHASTTTANKSGIACLLQLMKIDCVTNPMKSVNVLWDGGASVSLITFSKAEELGLKGKQVKLSIVKVGGHKEEILSNIYELPLKNKDGNTVTFQVYGIEKVSTRLQPTDISNVVNLFKDVTPSELERPEGEVDVLIGFEYANFHPVKEQSSGHLLYLRNQFGDCIGGSHPLLRERTRKIVQTVTIHHVERLTLEDFFKSESLGVNCVPRCGGCKCGKCQIGSNNYTLKEERELRLIDQNLVHREDHWEATYPWIRDPNELPDNKTAALKMLESTEKRLLRNPKNADTYQNQMEDMVNRDVARKLTDEEISNYKGPVFYISHHEVLKPTSVSTPCRIVFNPSARFNGHVLNDYWAKGPDLLNNMLGVLLLFREENIAVTGDVRKMYHSVKLSKLDQHTHRFLWRDLKTEKKPDTYVMTAVSFGDRPAGNIATIALRKTADMGKESFPRAAEMIVNNTYVDDVLDSFDDIENAKKVTADVNTLIAKGGFEIKKWCFSGPTASEVSGNDHQPQVPIHDNNNRCNIEEQRVLGVEWRPETDSFHFKVRLNFSPRKRKQRIGPDVQQADLPVVSSLPLTKRMVLSQVNGIYDPLGLVTPFTLTAKILLRKLCAANTKFLQWDDPIPDDMRDEWLKFFNELFGLTSIVFKRCIKPSNAVGYPTLVMFSDASNDAYGTCGYIRWRQDDGKFSSQLIASKNRIAPTKQISIVRLELNGALLSKRLAEFIKKETRFQFEEEYFIVDSEIVRSMIQKESYGFNTYVALRIGEIQEGTDPKRWFWTDGKQNIADWLTRPRNVLDIGEESEWQRGPAFLTLPEAKWPIKGESRTGDLPEQLKSVMHVNVANEETLADRIAIDRFSKYNRLIRVTARILSAYKQDPKPSLFNISHPPSRLIQEESVEFWVKEAQRTMITDLEKGKYDRLGGRLNENGIIVVGRRAERWMHLSYNNQALMLLPFDHRFSFLYARHIHELSHLGVASTSCKVRLRFWIIGLRKMVKSIVHNCVTCKMSRKETHVQIMGELPIERLKPCPAFHVISLDFFGPFEVRGETNKRSRGKAYGLIFDCLSSRAVHVELSTDYSTDAFLVAMRRFMAIRGEPRKIWSDSGSQLVSANQELKGFINGIDKEKLREFGSEKGIDWKFSTPDAPWQNGCAEALIKSVKKSITVAIGTQVLMFSELLTVCYEAANIVNERPIGIHPQDPEDGSYLCPNDLLLGRATGRISAGPYSDDPNPRKRFEFVQMLVNAFWKKWTRDFFPSLLVQQKWHTARRNLQIGDIVLIQDANMIRGNWKLGKVSNVFPSKDGMVRNVEVQYKNLDEREGRRYKGKKYTTVKRPVQRLVVVMANDG